MSLEEENQANRIPLLTEVLPPDGEQILDGEHMNSPRSYFAEEFPRANRNSRPQLSFWEYEFVGGESMSIDASLITPTSFRGSNYMNLYGPSLFRMCTIFTLCVLFATAPIMICISFMVSTQQKDVFVISIVVCFIPALVLIHITYLWLYFKKYGPVEYSNMMLRLKICHCNNHMRVFYLALQLAKYHLICKEYESALACCQRASNLSITQNHVYFFILASRLKVKVLSSMNLLEEAAQCLEEILDKEITFAKKALPISVLKRDHNNLARIKTKLCCYDEAFQIYEKVVQILKDANFENHVEMGHALVNMGNIQFQLDKHDEALVLYEKGLEIFRMNYGEFPRDSSLAKLHESIGDVCNHKGDIVSAKEHFEVAIEIFRRSGRSDGDRLVMKLMDKLNSLDFV